MNERFTVSVIFNPKNPNHIQYFDSGEPIFDKEVLRILKSGGTFMIVNEFDGISQREKKYEKLIDGLKLYSQQELVDYLNQAGFNNINLNHDAQKHWLTVLAHK